MSGFRIEGEWFTNLARDMVKEGRWRPALALLTESLDGLGLDDAVALLKGTKKLTGVNNLDITEDTAELEMERRLDWLYGNWFLYKGQLFCPRGRITLFLPEDMSWAKSAECEQALTRNRLWRSAWEDSDFKMSPAWRGLEDVGVRRCYAHATNPQKDLVFFIKGEALLCEHQGDESLLPLWFSAPRDFKSHLSAYVSGGEKQLGCLGEEALVQSRDFRKVSPAAPAVSTPKELTSSAVAEPEIFEEDAWNTRIEGYRKRVMELADKVPDGWLELKSFDKEAGRNVTLKIPRLAFECAALDRAKAFHLMPDYAPVCPSGLKLMNDCAYHTDAWLGTGQPLDKAYDSDCPEQRLFMAALYDYQRKTLNYEVDVLSRGSKDFVHGQVIHDPSEAGSGKILIVSEASAELAPAAALCEGVVCEKGSRLAHLVVVLREEGLPVLRKDNATHLFREGMRLGLEVSEGRITVI